jgi:hypothetical protein
MNQRINNFFLFFLGFNLLIFGQINTFDYQRKITGKIQNWNVINLPEDIYSRVSYDLTDIRIYGITSKKDTLEVPYSIRLLDDKVINKEIPFKVINSSSLNSVYYFTFEASNNHLINTINLDFENKNYDWNLKLEGSNDQNQWFSLAEDYRIVSISNAKTNYTFSEINFSNAKYNYYRISIKTNEKPILKSAFIYENSISKGKLRSFKIKNWKQIENKKDKISEIEINLEKSVMISQIQLKTKENFEYYRNISIEYLSDSVKSEKKWFYSYSNLCEGILSSIGNNKFNFPNITVKKIKIRIENEDNIPLNIDSIFIQGNVHELVFRSTQDAAYFLVYGNKNLATPSYDIEHFIDKLKEPIVELSVGNEEKISKKEIEKQEPLFNNQFWLWIIMGIIILVLGWFSVKMITNTQKEQ